ncbi:MAG TPA: hypothetical protein PLU71_00790 [Candidatus Dependentiae bacterium]|nr:hypothetical protein [Candidatus Dependentiae bacterium]HRQ62370.1 hypothetical protein [Candidatus Dependentiae bacterium]
MNIKWSSLVLSVLMACNAAAQVVIDQKTYVDLDLKHTDRKTLGDMVNNTITLSGRNRLNNLFLNPTASLDVLRNRQQCIAHLRDHEVLHTSLKDLLNQLAQHEFSLHEHIAKDPLVEKVLDRVYFSWPVLKKFNTSAYALYFGYITHIVGLCAPLAEHIALHMGIDLLASHKHCSHHDHGHKKHDHKKKHSHKKDHEQVSDLSYYGVQVLHWGLHVPGLYDMGADIWHRAQMMKYLQNEMIHIAAYVRKSRELYALLQKSHNNFAMIEAYNTLDNFFGSSATCSDACKRLFQLLERTTFTGEARVFNNVGNVLAAYNAYRDSRDELLLLADAIGDIDVWVGSAQLLKNTTKSDTWCFVTFAATESPRIVGKNVRHLFINKEQVRGWNISTVRGTHIFITGDNGAGKSTYLNGTGHAVILAQTLGIVPAEYFELTPFTHICTYRFIEDNIFEGTSRFYAECMRVDTILKTTQDSNGFCFVALDEPYTSTNRERGLQYLQEALAKLFGMYHVVSLTSTHYGSLNTLFDVHEQVQCLHLS